MYLIGGENGARTTESDIEKVKVDVVRQEESAACAEGIYIRNGRKILVRQKPCRGILKLPRFHLPHNTFDELVVILWAVLFLQAGVECPGKDLVESGFGRTEEGLHYLVAALVALAVDQLDE